MKLSRRIFLAFATAAILPASAFAQTPSIGVSLSAFDTFLTIVRGGMAKEAENQKVKIQFEDANNDVGRQVSQVENFIAQRVSAIVVNPVDTAATKRISAAARKAGIPLVYVNRKPDEKMGNGTVFVGSDSLVAGRLQMEELARRLNGKGNVAIMVGALSSDAAIDRTKGVKEVAKKFPGIKIVEEQVADFDRKKGIDLMAKWLSTGVKIDAIAANNDEMALGALIAMKQAKVSPKTVLVAGVDATPDALSSMKSNELALTVFQDAKGQGTGAVQAAMKMVKKEKLPDMNMIPYELVVQDNIAKYISKN
ncbi:sugar ABC transporter substrate-binding protein [Janthinobacterium psychrotolerans]|uniref:Inositol transport system substrate-binding protein n=1 Tax=Janthinobacterium psychrotolerans TaxID=1747903 RepID=A0A1A7C629_9BURK|nr:sugar ABC transporter substrate-binding protein [Janthinobacterium psychrotolerans]OBV39773.1 inositol transport system substrate-binding protein [Janthinobacterium psychrotolerans]